MSEIERFAGRRYEIIAFANGEKPVYYEEFGIYDIANSSWLLVTRGEDFRVYEADMASSCPSHPHDCRDYWAGAELEREHREEITRERAVDLVRRHNLTPFAVIPEATMRTLCEERRFVEVLKVHYRPDLRPGALPDQLLEEEEAAPAIIAAVKLEMGWPLVAEDVLEVDNREVQARALAVFGRDRLLAEAGAEVVDRDGANELLRMQNRCFVHVQDTVTSRRYFVEVSAETVSEALVKLAGWLVDTGRAGEAEPILRRVVAVAEARGEEGLLLQALGVLAVALGSLGRADESRSVQMRIDQTGRRRRQTEVAWRVFGAIGFAALIVVFLWWRLPIIAHDTPTLGLRIVRIGLEVGAAGFVVWKVLATIRAFVHRR